MAPLPCFQGNSYGPMPLKVRQKFPPRLLLVHGWLFPDINEMLTGLSRDYSRLSLRFSGNCVDVFPFFTKKQATQKQNGCGFFAYSWKLLAYNGALFYLQLTILAFWFFLPRLPLIRAPQKGARKKVPRENCRKVSKIFLTFFDVFALRENCRKVSKNILTLFDDFWRFLTWPLSAGPFCNPLIWTTRRLHKNRWFPNLGKLFWVTKCWKSYDFGHDERQICQNLGQGRGCPEFSSGQIFRKTSPENLLRLIFTLRVIFREPPKIPFKTSTKLTSPSFFTSQGSLRLAR